MLSDTSYPVAKATLPVEGENIQEIARRFYTHMFGEHPEMRDGLFNRGNQADGRQQQALAGSAAGFLVNKRTELPDHVLSRIAHNHVSPGLHPDQYRIVHDDLLWAIVDVPGDAVTPEVASAWDEVYRPMADAIITQERGPHEALRLSPETVWRSRRVVEKVWDELTLSVALRRRRPGVLGPAAGPGRRGHRCHPHGGNALPPGEGRLPEHGPVPARGRLPRDLRPAEADRGGARRTGGRCPGGLGRAALDHGAACRDTSDDTSRTRTRTRTRTRRTR
ncbi:globin domain-containing protein [Kocuria sp. M1R5S2]|uniref:globin domain-containing protein n=1 Tax=Kocuria rhizosphaerae TaxID=3376285 RepID=UPI003793171F